MREEEDAEDAEDGASLEPQMEKEKVGVVRRSKTNLSREKVNWKGLMAIKSQMGKGCCYAFRLTLYLSLFPSFLFFFFFFFSF